MATEIEGSVLNLALQMTTMMRSLANVTGAKTEFSLMGIYGPLPLIPARSIHQTLRVSAL